MQTLEPHIQFYIFTAKYIDLLIHRQNLTRETLSFISFFVTAIHYLYSVPDNLTFSVFFFPCCTMPTYIVLYTYIVG